MNTKIMVAVLVGIMGLYLGQITTGVPALIATIIGFISVLIACAFTLRRLTEKRDRW